MDHIQKSHNTKVIYLLNNKQLVWSSFIRLSTFYCPDRDILLSEFICDTGPLHTFIYNQRKQQNYIK